MNSPEGQYKGAIDCAIRMFVQEGGKAFYKGLVVIRWCFKIKLYGFCCRFVPSFYRLVAWNIMMWMTYEQMKNAVAKCIN